MKPATSNRLPRGADKTVTSTVISRTTTGAASAQLTRGKVLMGLYAGGIALKGRNIKIEHSARMRLMEKLSHANKSPADSYLVRVDAAVSAHLHVKRRGAEA